MTAIYLDNAATSWPKPDGVLGAIEHWFRHLGVDAARGTSRRHEEVSLRIQKLRHSIAKLTGVPTSGVVLTSGATAALNLYLKGRLRPGSHVMTSDLEHSSVVRPLVGLRERLGVEVRVVRSDSGRFVSPERVAAALNAGPPTELFVITHASNITGAIQDIPAIVAAAHAAGTSVLVDCAQTAGHLDLSALPADALVLPGHKGLMGPPGVGALCLRDDPGLVALIEGGTGSSRATDRMPDALPGSLESGTPNTPGNLGWLAGIEWVQEQGLETIHAREIELMAALHGGLADVESEGHLRRIGGEPERHTAIMSLSFTNYDPVEVAMCLEQHEIYTRAGFNCAPYIHEGLGTEERGSLRLSPGPFNTAEEIARVVELVADVVHKG